MSHTPELLQDLATILIAAAATGLICRLTKQPVVMGYLISGMVIGPQGFSMIEDLPSVQTWALLGVIFVMFSTGLEFSFRKVIRLSFTSGLVAAVEIFLMIASGYFVGRLLGWSEPISFLIGSMLAISSTTVIFKSLSDLGLTTHRFAERIVGILIFEDLFAIILLVSIGGMVDVGAFSGIEALATAGKLVVVIGSWFIVGFLVIPRFVRQFLIHGNNETITLLSIGLCLGLAVLSSSFGYSTALGAFIMGSILAEVSDGARIKDLVSPMRDLFGGIFFVSIGMMLVPSEVVEHGGLILTLVATIWIGKSVHITIGSLVAGETLSTSIQTAMGMTQIGEFSFIIAAMAASVGLIPSGLVSAIVAVSVLTTFMTPHMVKWAPWIATQVERRLPEKFTTFLVWYGTRVQSRGQNTVGIHQKALRWGASGIAVTVIFSVIAEYTHLLPDRIDLFVPRKMVAWVIAVLATAPFLWGMFGAFRGMRRAILLFGRAATIAWFGVLSLQFIPPWIAFIGVITVDLVLVVFFFRSLDETYSWFERNLIASMGTHNRRSDLLRSLAPWDAHLVECELGQSSALTGYTLEESQIRIKTGLVVVALQRGESVLSPPDPSTRLFPKDKLLVLGTDEQIDQGRNLIESQDKEGLGSTLSEYVLEAVAIDERSDITGKSLAESKIRETHRVIVVGIERELERISAPRANEQIKSGDALWVVGMPESITAFREHNATLASATEGIQL